VAISLPDLVKARLVWDESAQLLALSYGSILTYILVGETTNQPIGKTDEEANPKGPAGVIDQCCRNAAESPKPNPIAPSTTSNPEKPNAMTAYSVGVGGLDGLGGKLILRLTAR
jgi:hypothetical protein